MPPKGASVGGQNPEFVLREFMGMNVLDGREAINDNEFYWAENIIPVAPAQTYPVAAATSLFNSTFPEANTPSYTMSFAANGQNFIFVVFSLGVLCARSRKPGRRQKPPSAGG